MMFILQLQLTRIGVPTPQNTEPQTVIVPVLHIIGNNTTQVAEQRTMPNIPSTAAIVAMKNMMKRFHDFNPDHNRCTIFPSVRELVANLVIPL